MVDQIRPSFRQTRVFTKARELAVSSLLTLGKHTVTGMLSAGGKQFDDWSAAYRLFEKERIDQKDLFIPAINKVIECRQQDEPLFVMMDDTLIRKKGRKVYGAGWKRDPLGPAFHTNFVWGQRYLQISASLPDTDARGRARGIPIDFCHAPSPVKPRKNAPKGEWDTYRKQREECKVSTLGAMRLGELRKQVKDRKIVCAVDGGFTNKTMFQSLAENTVLIGRIRKDANLFTVPDDGVLSQRGRKRYYGASLPTPEQIRQDDSMPWQKVTAFAAGKNHEFEIKTVSPVRWKGSRDRDVRLVVVRPIAYRPRNGSRLLYRNPAYLICSDTQMPLNQLLQAYLWRWEIELNFRDEKTVMGVGEANVRTPSSVRILPAMLVASYSFLLLATCSKKAVTGGLPPPKWYPHKPSDRCTTQKALSLFRSSFWGMAMDNNLDHFVSMSPKTRTRFFSAASPNSAICYAVK